MVHKGCEAPSQHHLASALFLTKGFPEHLFHPGRPVGRSPGDVAVTLGVDPEAVVGDPVPLVAALAESAQDVGVTDNVPLATLQNDRNTAPVQQPVDRD